MNILTSKKSFLKTSVCVCVWFVCYPVSVFALSLSVCLSFCQIVHIFVNKLCINSNKLVLKAFACVSFYTVSLIRCETNKGESKRGFPSRRLLTLNATRLGAISCCYAIRRALIKISNKNNSFSYKEMQKSLN